MLYRWLQSLVRRRAMNTGKGFWLYQRVCQPDSKDYAEYLRRHGGLYAIGENVGITLGTEILDPAFVRIGSNVLLANCTLIGHDGSIEVLNRAYGVKIDRVGKIDIRDNVFIGHGAIILPGVTIGPNALVAAGSVVSQDVAPGDVVGGVPARKIGSMDETVRKLVAETESLPWVDVIKLREGAFDPRLEAELNRRRIAHFFPEGADGAQPAPSKLPGGGSGSDAGGTGSGSSSAA